MPGETKPRPNAYSAEPLQRATATSPIGRRLFAKGNPGGGRPRGARRLMDDIYRVLAEPASGDELQHAYDRLEIPDGLRAEIDLAVDRQDAFVRILVFQALRGHMPSIEAMLSRMAPAPKHVEVSGRGGGPIKSANLNATITGAAAQQRYLALMDGSSDGGDADESDVIEIDPLA